MKELSMVKQMVSDGVITQEIAERYFPELKESEDERIREALIEEFLGWSKDTSFGKTFQVSRDDILGWLEKQGEQQPVEWSEEDESMLQNILECLKNGWRKLPTDILKYESWLKSLRP